MMRQTLRIAFVRRGYSPSGGAEAYLRRLARGLVDRGHNVQLLTGEEWPDAEWPFGALTRVRLRSTIAFALATSGSLFFNSGKTAHLIGAMRG